MGERKWLNVELTVGQTVLFTDYLKKNKIKYETSACYNLIHIEVYVNNDERQACDRYLSNINTIL